MAAGAAPEPIESVEILWSVAKLEYDLSAAVTDALESAIESHLRLVDSSSVLAGSVPKEIPLLLQLFNEAKTMRHTSSEAESGSAVSARGARGR